MFSLKDNDYMYLLHRSHSGSPVSIDLPSLESDVCSPNWFLIRGYSVQL